jgi:hypothetical protein
MSKRFVESLRRLSTEEVTQKLADYCEKRLNLLTDPHKGSLRTLFGVASMLVNAIDLVRVAAEKYGIEERGHDLAIAAIGRAASERGSPAAKKILECADAIEEFDRIGRERHAGFWERIRIGKEFGPKPA